MNKIKKIFRLAADVAMLGDCKGSNRKYKIGAVGIRSDGVIVCASNVSTRRPFPEAHAEHRLCKKLTTNSIVFVVRIDAEGNYRLAKPCATCLARLKIVKTRKVYYTINNFEYGVIEF